jgi:predicted transcriptional regulator
MKKKIPEAPLVRKAEQYVINAGRKAAREVERGLCRAIQVAAEHAVHLHKSAMIPKERAIQAGVQAVLNSIKQGR